MVSEALPSHVATEVRLPGMRPKRKRPYQSGRSKHWVKVSRTAHTRRCTGLWMRWPTPPDLRRGVMNARPNQTVDCPTFGAWSANIPNSVYPSSRCRHKQHSRMRDRVFGEKKMGAQRRIWKVVGAKQHPSNIEQLQLDLVAVNRCIEALEKGRR